jgi:hypothetical protein
MFQGLTPFLNHRRATTRRRGCLPGKISVDFSLLTYLLTPWLLRLRDTSSKNTPPPRRSTRARSFLPGCFVPRGSFSTWAILNIRFLRRGFVSTSPNPQAGGPPLVGCPRPLVQFIHSYPPYRRPFLHPQPEEAPCRGDRDPHSWVDFSCRF